MFGSSVKSLSCGFKCNALLKRSATSADVLGHWLLQWPIKGVRCHVESKKGDTRTSV